MTNYKQYALDKLEDWMHDVLSCDDVTPQEIYDTIYKVVTENYYHHKYQASRSYELMEKLNGQVVFTTDPKGNVLTVCDKDNQSPECNQSWNNFWEDDMPPWGHSDMEALSNYKEDKVVKWQLPVEVDSANGEYFVSFPDDLLDAANLKEGDTVEWVDNGDGSYTLKKVVE